MLKTYRFQEISDDDLSEDEDQPCRKRPRRKAASRNGPVEASSSSTSNCCASKDKEAPRKVLLLGTLLAEQGFRQEDVVICQNRLHCPHKTCSQTFDLSISLARHLESKAHGTHSYMCLDTSCLKVLTAAKSLYDHHHTTAMFRGHKKEHDRAVKRGLLTRIKNTEIESYRKEVKRKMAPY